ncbi:heparan-alpha-glucosaminide N-acetyltransferase-like protein, partial [Euroglyphus maynei]
MLESGENQWISALIVIIVYLIAIFALVYGHQSLMKIWENYCNRHSTSSPPSSLSRHADSPTFVQPEFVVPPPPSSIRQSNRFHSIDAFRGMAIMLMIFVNYGAGQYKSLQHVPWDGFHLAD